MKDRLLDGREWKGEAVTGERWTRCRLKGEWELVTFEKCRLIDCDFSRAVFKNVGFLRCTLAGSKLAFVNFSEMAVKEVDFSESVMDGCLFYQLEAGSKNRRKKMDGRSLKFEKTSLRKAVLIEVDLREVSFREADLEQAVFERCDLRGADWVGAKVGGTRLDGCRLENTKLDTRGLIEWGRNQGFVLDQGI